MLVLLCGVLLFGMPGILAADAAGSDPRLSVTSFDTDVIVVSLKHFPDSTEVTVTAEAQEASGTGTIITDDSGRGVLGFRLPVDVDGKIIVTGVVTITATGGSAKATGNITISSDNVTQGPEPSPAHSPPGGSVAEPKPDIENPTSPPAADPWSVPFLGRTPSGPITCNGQSNVTISGKQFVGIGNDQSSILISNCHHVVITANDFKDVAQPITVVNSTDVEISWNRYENITGPHERNGSHRANFTQWGNAFGGSIHHNKGIGGDTEDIVSIYQSGGTDASHPLVIEHNAFEGTNWTSSSSTGMMLGDAGGSHIVVRNNTLLSPGQVGIGIAGTDIHVTENIIYGALRGGSNVGIQAWTCEGVEVAHNSVKWINANGLDYPAEIYGCGSVAGWDTNDFAADLDPATLHVTL